MRREGGLNGRRVRECDKLFLEWKLYKVVFCIQRDIGFKFIY